MAAIHFYPIPEGEEERIFERYYRTDDAKRKDPTGTGIGLQVARDIIKSHGGELKAKPSTKVSDGFKTVFTGSNTFRELSIFWFIGSPSPSS